MWPLVPTKPASKQAMELRIMRPLDVSPEEIRLTGALVGCAFTDQTRKNGPKNGASGLGEECPERTHKPGTTKALDMARQTKWSSRYSPTPDERFKPQQRANYTNTPRLHTLQWSLSPVSERPHFGEIMVHSRRFGHAISPPCGEPGRARGTRPPLPQKVPSVAPRTPTFLPLPFIAYSGFTKQ